MSGITVEHTYQYRFSSGYVESQEGSDRGNLCLATDVSVPLEEKVKTFGRTSFFDGVLIHPKRAADLLRAVSEIVTARFNNPLWQRLADPVVTCADKRLRFEGFSSCCSAYASAEFLPEALDGCWATKGTTNVDFNPGMLSALRSIRDSDYVNLSVGSDAVALACGAEKVVERKVALPVRWIKAFAEIQICQSRMVPVIEVSGLQARNFLFSIPKSKSRTPFYIMPSGKGLRLSSISGHDAVKVAGLERLRVLESFIHNADALRIYGDEETGSSAWELIFSDARFVLVISADVWRGFSGEGQILTSLAQTEHEKYLDSILKLLEENPITDTGVISRRTGASPQEVRSSLAALGSRGLIGYDLDNSSWFYRVLPFNREKIESLQPRLLNARKLIKENRVRITKKDRNNEKVEAFVKGSDVEYYVRLTEEESKCTCPWYAKHQSERGSCKHILAVKILLESEKKSDR